MIAFEIHRNDQRIFIAGVGDFGVLLAAAVTWFGHSADRVERLKAEGSADAEPLDLRLDVGGLRNDVAGDEVRIRVIEATEVDPPIREQHRDDPMSDVEQKKAYVRKLAADLGWRIQEPDSA